MCQNVWKHLRSQSMKVRVSMHSLRRIFFYRFGTPRDILSNSNSHFCNKLFKIILKKYDVRNNVATPNLAQTSKQVDVSNQDIK